MSHCTGYGNCHQGRKPCMTQWACNVRTGNGGESVNNGLPVEMFDNTPSMFARRGFWIAGAVSFALLWSAVALLDNNLFR